MRNLILLLISTLSLSTTLFTLFTTTHAHAHALPSAHSLATPTPTPAPPPFSKRSDDNDASLVSAALASATSAIAAHPSSASSIINDLRATYGTILNQASGCDSSRWARITGALTNLDDDFGDGLSDLVDGIFDGDGDDDECQDNGDDDDDDGLIEELLDNAGVSRRSSGVVVFGVVGVVVLAGAALL